MSAFRRKLRVAGKVVLKPNGEPEREPCWRFEFKWPGVPKPFRQGGFATKRDAEVAEKLARDAMRRGKVDDLRRALGQVDITIASLIEDYIAARCPGRFQEPRLGEALANETANLRFAGEWWGPRDPRTINGQADCNLYFAWRQTKTKRGTGARSTELELQSMNNCLAWAAGSGKIPTNPLVKRPRYRKPGGVSHARDRMPANVEELHTIGRHLASDPRSEVSSWAWLLGAFTGLRSEELGLLRAHATRTGIDPEPGYIDERFLYVHRCKSGINPRVRLDDPERPYIRPLLDMIRNWHAVRYPASEWLLPGRGGEQLGETTFTNAVAMACKTLKLPRRRAHGVRAYYATVRLCQGQSPEDVARELGQGSGSQLIKDTYGVDPDDWQAEHWTALAEQYTWVPSKALPAWQWWTEKPSNIISL